MIPVEVGQIREEPDMRFRDEAGNLRRVKVIEILSETHARVLRLHSGVRTRVQIARLERWPLVTPEGA